MNKPAETLYKKLHAISKEIAVLSSASSILEWDQETYMPLGAISLRSSQLEMLANLTHKMRTGSRFKNALGQLIDIQNGDLVFETLPEEKNAALREWRRDYLRMVRLPASFVKSFSKTTSQAMHAWSDAKRNNTFRTFRPHLEKIVNLNRKKADYLGFQNHPYDALLDLYEPDMTVATLTPLFGRLKIALLELLKQISAQPQPRCEFLHAHYPAIGQMRFAHLLLKSMGFVQETSRLDESMHPFCIGNPFDTRMTTHVHHEAPMANFFAVLHEGGHGLYAQGLPTEEFGSPLCESASLGIDESQSRFWETLIGHSRPFWHHFLPLLEEEFAEQIGGIDLDSFYRAINIVKPSYIRIHADEVTYSLHVIIRFEIEKSLIEGTMQVKELPEVWGEKMREYLGIQPRSDAEGCLQDIHWSMGAMGYFPTYTLGNIYSAQLREVFIQDHPDWEAKISRGELHFIREWLREKIHRCGRHYPPATLIQRATGSALSEIPYIHYLEKKFKALYPGYTETH
jgi:carboxypeptidase Taq